MHLSEISILLLTNNIKHFFMQQVSYKFRQYWWDIPEQKKYIANIFIIMTSLTKNKYLNFQFDVMLE